MKELISLFLTFERIGAFTFGGGYAMLPMLQREVVRAGNGQRRMKCWITLPLGSVPPASFRQYGNIHWL